MSQRADPKLSKTPFFLATGLLLAAAGCLYFRTKVQMGTWEIGLAVACVVAGAVFGVVPFLLEYRALVRVAEADSLVKVVAQIQHFEETAARIAAASSQWQAVQEQDQQTMAAAKDIAERMKAEARAFTQFMERASEAEKAHLRFEAEKLRRNESDWLQASVRMLDHVYALHQGAIRSGQPTLMAQVGNFHSACREAMRRVGLTPFTAVDSEPFDAQRHQLADGDGQAPPDALVGETIAAGYTFQGRLLRQAVVRLRVPPLDGAAEPDTAAENGHGDATASRSDTLRPSA